MRVDIYEPQACEPFRRNVTLAECYPDMPDEAAAAAANIGATGQHWEGGGAAALFLLTITGAGRSPIPPVASTRTQAVDLTPIGEQYVIPGCERDQARGPEQRSLW